MYDNTFHLTTSILMLISSHDIRNVCCISIIDWKNQKLGCWFFALQSAFYSLAKITFCSSSKRGKKLRATRVSPWYRNISRTVLLNVAIVHRYIKEHRPFYDFNPAIIECIYTLEQSPSCNCTPDTGNFRLS